MHVTNCRYCGGAGTEPDRVAIGAELREEREKAGVSQTQIARKMGLSCAYICDSEAGRKAWPQKKIARYRGAIREIVEKR